MPSLAACSGTPVRTDPLHHWPVIDPKEREAVLAVYDSGNWGSLSGGRVAKFQDRFSKAHDAEWGVAVVNGTVALVVSLRALDIGIGDEVIVPPYTFLATATAVLEVGATPIFVDIDPETYNIDLNQIEDAITPETKAIIPVHFAGLPVDLDQLLEIANRHGLKIIEDAAHAHGAKWDGKGCGSFGDTGCFSFQASKNMNAGEGGIIIGNDQSVLDRVRAYMNCGRLPDSLWYEHHVLGGNFRMTEFQAAIMLGQLDRLDEDTETRNQNGLFLNDGFSQIPGLTPTARGCGETNQAYHLYILKFDPKVFGQIDKFQFGKAMEAEGTPMSTGYYVPLYKQPLFTEQNFWPKNSPKSAAMYTDLPDYGAMRLEATETACSDEALWIEQYILLGDRQTMQDYIDAAAKIHENQGELAE
ncbi:MAG: DegT/DnrJ/EryC1/StrS family aminotransferase [Candidatus Latescibacteria bacterium]|nr:DegT/DnrJ/EryC1/StrS family aminotransferase [Candidatus Latescibacterota bacterium]